MATYIARKLEVSLPRFRLSFFINANRELECRSMPGYVIDESQSCGTMCGLTNKLILRPGLTSSEDSLLSLLPRRVIIPQGDVSFKKVGDFTSVTINTDAEQHIRWHEYTVDTDLGCLTSNTSLCNKLYQCYLHALTSHCLPDPLLGHTGTEEALYILQSASCRSFQRLDVHEAKLLDLIGDLTPEREYYPRHLQSMATVKWNDLPALSQHHDFFQITCALFDHARTLEVLYDQPAVFETSNRNQSLLSRAASRNKSYYPSDVHILEQPSSPDDVIYRSRDVSDHEAAEHVAFQTSWAIWNGRPSLDRNSPSLWNLMVSWGSLGPSESKVSLRYSRYWLEFNATRDWFVIYDLCRKAVDGDGRDAKIRLSFSLSAAAYNGSDIIPFVMVFALDKRCRDLDPPPDRSYMLSDGLAPELTRLANVVSQSALPMHLTPVRSLQAKQKRKKTQYNATISRESSRVAGLLLRQWPSYQSVDLPGEWFDKSCFNTCIKPYIQSISRNIRLKEHVEQLQGVLQKYSLTFPTAPNTPYTFSPRFITKQSKAPSYSLPHVLLSRTNTPTVSADWEPFQDLITPRTATTEDNPVAPQAGPDSLKILVDELRNSQQPLQKLYGNELNKSHRALLRQIVSQPVRRPTMARPASSVPPVRASRMCMSPSPVATVKVRRASRIALREMPLCAIPTAW